MTAPFPVVRARLGSAPAGRDLARVRAAARELPSVVTLADAVQVLLLMEEVEDPAFEAAAVRWIARLTTECRGLTPWRKNVPEICRTGRAFGSIAANGSILHRTSTEAS